MKNRRPLRMRHIQLQNRIVWMVLILTPFLILLLWDEVENPIENFESKNMATQEPLYVEDVNGPMYNMHPFIREQEDGDSSLRIYPYSVVNGGVHSVQDLRSAIGRDPVVARHYSNFKLDRARVIEAEADGYFHVSYRIGNEIFWTKRRLKVAKSERLITDGANFTRTRCANVLSEAPQGKTSLNEPTPEVLDTPILFVSDPTPFIPPVIIPGEPLDPGSPILPPFDPTPFIPPVITPGEPLDPGPPILPPFDPTPFIPPGPIPGPGPGPAPDPGTAPNPVPVPEPTTLLLLASGLASFWGFRKKFKK